MLEGRPSSGEKRHEDSGSETYTSRASRVRATSTRTLPRWASTPPWNASPTGATFRRRSAGASPREPLEVRGPPARAGARRARLEKGLPRAGYLPGDTKHDASKRLTERGDRADATWRVNGSPAASRPPSRATRAPRRLHASRVRLLRLRPPRAAVGRPDLRHPRPAD